MSEKIAAGILPLYQQSSGMEYAGIKSAMEPQSTMCMAVGIWRDEPDGTS